MKSFSSVLFISVSMCLDKYFNMRRESNVDVTVSLSSFDNTISPWATGGIFSMFQDNKTRIMSTLFGLQSERQARRLMWSALVILSLTSHAVMCVCQRNLFQLMRG